MFLKETFSVHQGLHLFDQKYSKSSENICTF